MDIPSAAPAIVAIDVVSDVVCPWCYLGKRRLARALTLVPEVSTTVRWHPFSLDPTVPPEGLDRQDYLQRKFGTDLGRIDAAHERLVEFGRREGIDYRFDLIRRAPNTLDAHRLTRWIPVERQEAAVEALFHANFTEGRDVGSHAVLSEIGATFGLDAAETRSRLAGPEDRGEITAEIEHAYRIGVTGVPCFIIDQRYAVTGAEAPEEIAAAIRGAVAARAGEIATA